VVRPHQPTPCMSVSVGACICVPGGPDERFLGEGAPARTGDSDVEGLAQEGAAGAAGSRSSGGVDGADGGGGRGEGGRGVPVSVGEEEEEEEDDGTLTLSSGETCVAQHVEELLMSELVCVCVCVCVCCVGWIGSVLI